MPTNTFPANDAGAAESVLCSACHRSNLTGGVRCAYCGSYLPTTFDFNLTVTEAAAPSAPVTASSTGTRVRAIGTLGTLGLLVLKLKSIFSLLSIGKIVITLGSMLVFIWVRGAFFGWRFGVGLAICILIHEMGHVFVNWRKGIPQSAPMFIPFLGAVILIKKFPDNPEIEADSGAGGPIAGGLAAIGCLGLGYFTADPFYYLLAQTGFLINLFNLIPFPPLDGSHMGAVFSPKAWWGFLAILVLWSLKISTPVLWVIILATLLIRLGQPSDGRYLLAAPKARARMVAIYAILCLGLGWGAMHSYNIQPKNAVSASQIGDRASTSVQPDSVQKPVAPTQTPGTLSPRQATVLWMVRGLLAAALSLLWWGAVRQVGRISGNGWTRADGGLLATLLGGSLAVLALRFAVPVGLVPSVQAVQYACFAAAAFALIWGLVQASLAKRQARRGHSELVRLQLLGAAALGALLVLYVTFDLALGAALVALVGIFYALNRASWWLTLAFVASFVGDELRAETWAERAEASASSVLAIALRQRQILRLLANDRGDAALTLLDENAQAGDDTPLARVVQRNQEALALMQAGRIAESLTALEKMLQAAQPVPRLALAALQMAHQHLANLAVARGWWDEVVAQIDWLARHVGRSPHYAPFIAQTRALVAAAQFAQGTTSADTVDAACNRALAVSHDASGRAFIACVQCWRNLTEGNRDAARLQVTKAAHLRPNNLEVTYWQARVQGREALQMFATLHAANYYGQQAQADADDTGSVLATPPTAPVPVAA